MYGSLFRRWVGWTLNDGSSSSSVPSNSGGGGPFAASWRPGPGRCRLIEAFPRNRPVVVRPPHHVSSSYRAVDWQKQGRREAGQRRMTDGR